MNNIPAVVYREEVMESDLAGVHSVVRSSGFFSPEETAVAMELVAERLKSGKASGYFFLFAEHEREVVGYTCYGPVPCTESSYDLYWIAVHDDFRFLGLGRELLERTEKEIRALGGSRIYIETSSRGQYEPTRAFYRKCGYRDEAIFKDFYAPGDSKIVYVKTIA